MIVAVASLVAAAADLEGFAYVPGKAGAADAQFTRWKPGDQVPVGVDEANLRKSPAADAPVVGTLPLASKVTITAVSGAPVVVTERRNVWYEVRADDGATGFLFGTVLSPLVGTTDDGARWGITFNPAFGARLRFQDAKGRVTGLDLAATTRFRGGRLEAALDTRGELEQILQVSQCRLDGGAEPACSTAKVSWSDGAPRQINVADSWRFEPAPAPTLADCAGPALAVSPIAAAPVRTLEIPSYLRGPRHQVPCTAVGRVTGGAYAGRRLVVCAIWQSGKGGPDTLFRERFVEGFAGGAGPGGRSPPEGKDGWVHLGCTSNSGYVDDLAWSLADAGVAVTYDGDAVPPSDGAPAWTGPGLVTDAWWTPSIDPHALVKLGEVPGVGPVFTARDPGLPQPWARGALVVPSPGGGARLLAWSADVLVAWDIPSPPPAAYRTSTVGCSGSPDWHENLVPEPIADADVTRVGRLDDGTPVYVLKSASHPVNQRLLAAYHALPTGNGRPPIAPGLDDKALLASIPWMFLRDPWHRWVQVARDDFQPPAVCEPLVRVYADPPRAVHVALDPAVDVFRSIPAHGDDGWTGVALPDGSVRIGGARVRELFWEGRSAWFPPPADGFVVAGDAVEDALARWLPAEGLAPDEVARFMDHWVPLLAVHPWVRIGFHDPAELDVIAPLEVDPAPDRVVRVWIDAAPVDGPDGVPEPPLPVPPDRDGHLVVVEWGGVWRSHAEIGEGLQQQGR